MLLGKTLHRCVLTLTGLSPSTAPHSKGLQLHTHFLTASPAGRPIRALPQPPTHNPCRVSHAHGLAILRFRSPLLTESLLFSLPAGTEMFHFPAFPPRTLCVQMRVTRQLAPLAGFPHSDTLGSQSGYRLPQAYRRFLRPSSAPNAKASTVCS